MVTVGVLATLINVAVLLIVSFANRALEHIVRHFAAARLERSHRAPIVHDSDTWLPNIPRSIIRYRRHPGKNSLPISTYTLKKNLPIFPFFDFRILTLKKNMHTSSTLSFPKLSFLLYSALPCL